MIYQFESDSVAFLRQWDTRKRGPIHLLYLDSVDHEDPQKEASEEHQRREAEAALPSLARRCLVLCDDTVASGCADSQSFSGKGARAVPFLLVRGFRLEWHEGNQVLLSRGAPSPAAEPCARHASEGRGTFQFQGRCYRYFEHVYNGAGGNERTVEVPLALALLEDARGHVLEVGNVLSHYGITGHTVVDRYEPGPGVLNVDIDGYAPDAPFDLIVSISTLEHVGWDEQPRDPEKVARVLHRLRCDLLSPRGRLLVTVPMGYNPHLDRLILEGRTGTALAFLRRLNEDNEWQETSRGQLGAPEYDRPFPYGNAVAVLTRGCFNACEETSL